MCKLPKSVAIIVVIAIVGGCSRGPVGAKTSRSPRPADREASGRRLAGKLVLTGSSTVAPLAAEIAQRFERRHPETRVDVQTGGSSRGIADARSGGADVGMASRTLDDDEQDLLAHKIAVDGIALIVHKDNPIDDLRDDQIVGIYTKRIQYWNEVGGRDEPIVVVHKAEGRATLEVFLEYFEIANADVHAAVIIGDNQQGIKTVAGNPQAIGYVSVGTAAYEAQHGVPIKLLPSGGIAPTRENVANGTFPITRPLNLVTISKPEGLTKAFLDFARSADVYDLVEAHFFVPLKQ